MGVKLQFSKWWLVPAAIAVLWVYNAQTSKPVSSLAATSDEARPVYAGPNVNTYAVLGTLPAHTSIVLTGRSGDTWVTFDFGGQQGWIQDFFLSIDGRPARLPEVEVRRPQPTSLAPISDEEGIRLFLRALILDPRYDESVNVLHKYLDSLAIDLTSSIVTYTVLVDVPTADDFAALGAELALATALLSNAGQPDDWMLTRIELYSPGPQGSYAALFIAGHSDIVAIATGSNSPYDLMQTDVSYGTPAPSGAGGSSSCPNGCMAPLSGCDIKGNISFDTGEKIYHVPGDEYYAETVISPDYGERWFCTGAEAETNGWRRTQAR
jgi:uncharacterized protein YraI